MEIEKKYLVFSNGDIYECANIPTSPSVGILKITYFCALVGNRAHTHLVSSEKKAELANAMIDQWTKFKQSL